MTISLIFGLMSVLICSTFVSCSDLEEGSSQALILRQILEKYQPMLFLRPTPTHLFRRFDVNVREECM